MTQAVDRQGGVLCVHCKLLHWKQRPADCTASTSVKEELVQAARLCCFLCNGSCVWFAALRHKLDTTVHSCPVLPQALCSSGYRFLPLLRAAHLETLACPFTLFYCDSCFGFTNTTLSLCLLSAAMNSYTGRSVHDLPALSRSVRQLYCCALLFCLNTLV